MIVPGMTVTYCVYCDKCRARGTLLYDKHGEGKADKIRRHRRFAAEVDAVARLNGDRARPMMDEAPEEDGSWLCPACKAKAA